jgi:hypothetical protein
MQTIVYGAKTFILENPTAAKLMNEANQLRTLGNLETGQELVSLAVKVETGSMTAGEALMLAYPQRAAA